MFKFAIKWDPTIAQLFLQNVVTGKPPHGRAQEHHRRLRCITLVRKSRPDRPVVILQDLWQVSANVIGQAVSHALRLSGPVGFNIKLRLFEDGGETMASRGECAGIDSGRI